MAKAAGVTLALAAVLGLSSTACDLHLLGTHDVRLDYTLAAPARGASGGHGAPALEDVRHAVTRRLSAGQVTADIDVEAPATLHVTLDSAFAKAARELLAYHGGLSVCRLDPSYVYSVGDAKGVKPEIIALEDGKTAQAYVGEAEDVVRAARSAVVDEHHRIVVTGYRNGARTLAVKWPPVLAIEQGIEDVDADGKAIAIKLATTAEAQAQEAARTVTGEKVAFVRDRIVASIEPLADPRADGSLVVHTGEGLVAYTRAEHLRRLVDSGTLPDLVPEGETPLAPVWPLAILGLLLPMALSLAWLSFVRRFDRARPEPLWLVMLTFVLGGLSVVPAGLAELLLPSLTDYLNPELMTLGGQALGLPLGLCVFVLVVGGAEEGSKFLAAFVVAKRSREFDEPVDGIVYGAAASLGFAAVENIRYFAEGRLSPTLIVTRALMTVPAHLFFGAIWGYALGQKLVRPKLRVWPYLLLAAVMHGAFDTFLSIHGTAPLSLLINLVLASSLIVLLRRSLRHGVVTPAAARVDPATRGIFPMGVRGTFVVSTVGLHVAAGLILVLGVYAETRHGRIGYGSLAVAALLLAAFGLSAAGIARAMPLDVVVDDFGVTFGGAAVPWGDVLAVEHRALGIGGMQEIHLKTKGGPVRLGPGPAANVQELARALARRAKPVPGA